MHILVVCTANRCRSPMAAALLVERLHEASSTWGAVVRSAGVLEPGFPVPQEAIDELERLGVDLRDHRSTRLDESMVESADLVIGMAREHVREVLGIDADAWSKTFTLKELLRRGRATGGRRDGESLSAWLARLAADRRSPDVMGSARADDVDDPFGRSRRAYRKTARELDDLTRELVQLLDARPVTGTA